VISVSSQHTGEFLVLITPAHLKTLPGALLGFDACWLGKCNEANEVHRASYLDQECICIPVENLSLSQTPLVLKDTRPDKPATRCIAPLLNRKKISLTAVRFL